jgi:hypothetical protein
MYEYHCVLCDPAWHYLTPAEVMRMRTIAEMHGRATGRMMTRLELDVLSLEQLLDLLHCYVEITDSY